MCRLTELITYPFEAPILGWQVVNGSVLVLKACPVKAHEDAP